MERNLYKRIEIMFPILDENCRTRIKEEILENYLKDNKNAWEMQADGSYKAITSGNYSAQEKLLQRYAPKETNNLDSSPGTSRTKRGTK